MAASPTPRPSPADALRALPALLAAQAPALPVAVALSGGADSSALLLAARHCWPGQVRALHVHHGLQAAGDAFEAHCRALCARLDVPLSVLRVDARARPGQSPQDAARSARYAALASAAQAQAIPTVWLAQHADDQVETLLLALSRGAGLPGLAGMGDRFTREGVTFGRPLLQLAGAALRDWLTGQGESWVEDPSNADTGYTRNRIRHHVLPALQEAFPSLRETVARSMRHVAQAQDVLDEFAEQDLRDMGGEPVLARLQALSRGRQANLLRHWLRKVHDAAASQAQLDELLAQVADCRTRGHHIRLKVAAGFVERAADRLRYSASL